MNKIVLALIALSLSACATANRSPINGIFYNDIQGPDSISSNSAGTKVGESCAQAVLGFATGDASIETARKNGGISQISYVDNYVTSILGVWVKYCTRVHGK